MSQIMADVKAGKYEMSPLKNRLDPVYDDPYNLWNSANINAGGGNISGYSNPEIDRITEEIRTAEEESTRNDLYKKFQEILYEDQAALFLYAPKEPVLISKKYTNAKPTVLKPGFVLNYFH
jgi:peptide/nickel transport system substrate-binding protein